jgi:TolB-like protein/Tfp pilus assembly protein PilF
LRNLRRRLDVDAEIDRTVAPALRSTSVAAAPSTQHAQPRTVSSAEYVFSGIKQHKFAAAIVLLAIVGITIGAVAYLRGGNTGSTIHAIAVMPFVNASGNAELEYLSDGITETLMSNLSQVPNLHVKARSLVFRYKGKETNPQTVGKDLDVQAVLNGRMVQRGPDLIVYLELVDARTGNLIWSDQYNRKQSDLVSLQNDLARDVSKKLRTKLTGAEEQQLTKNYTENSEAYKLYLQGRFFANKRTPKDSQRAIECFEHAASLDPNYALAYTGLGLGYSYLAIYGYSPAKEVFPKAREYATKALELDGSLAEPHLTLGIIAFLDDHDMAGWERENKRALELNPNSTDAHRLEGLRLLFLGKFEESIAEVKRALDIEPLSLAGNINYSYCLFYAGRLAESEAQTKKTVDLSPDFWMSHYYLFKVYLQQRKYAEATHELALAKEYRGENEAAQLIRQQFAKGGWQGLLKEAATQPAPLKFWQYDLAQLYAEMGDKENAFARLNQAIEDREQFIGFVKVEPSLQPLRSDPRFAELLKKAGLPQ